MLFHEIFVLVTHTCMYLLESNLNIFLSVGCSILKNNESHCSACSNRTSAVYCGIPIAVTFVMCY